jgi:hypothetical protein
MSEETREVFQAMKRDKSERRQKNTESSTQILIDHAIPFESRNGGAHLIVVDYDFWPSTGLFMHRKTKKRGRGVYKLIAAITHRK